MNGASDDGRIPFKQNHFIRASSLVGRMKVIGQMNSLAGLHVASIKQVSFLVLLKCQII
jgi:hypothetical protein